MSRPLAGWIKKHREAKNWSAAELAHNLTVAGYETKEGTIRVWEAPKGRDPKPETIAALERMFGAIAPVQADPRDEALARIADVLERADGIHELHQEVVRLGAEVGRLRGEVSQLRRAVEQQPVKVRKK